MRTIRLRNKRIYLDLIIFFGKINKFFKRCKLTTQIRLLNDYEKKKNEVARSVSNFVVPMNYDSCMSLSLC